MARTPKAAETAAETPAAPKAVVSTPGEATPAEPREPVVEEKANGTVVRTF